MPEMRFRREAALMLTLVMMLTSSTSADAQNLLTDLFESGAEGWTVPYRPMSTVEWDRLNGSPDPGSLRFSSTISAPLQGTHVSAVSECVNALPNESLVTSAMVLRPAGQSGVRCLLTMEVFEEADCAGYASSYAGLGTTNNPPVVMEGVWQRWETTFHVHTFYRSVRAALLIAIDRSPPPPSECLIDTVAITSDIRTHVPTLSWPGLMVLSLLVALAAVTVLRRSGSRRAAT